MKLVARSAILLCTSFFLYSCKSNVISVTSPEGVTETVDSSSVSSSLFDQKNAEELYGQWIDRIKNGLLECDDKFNGSKACIEAYESALDSKKSEMSLIGKMPPIPIVKYKLTTSKKTSKDSSTSEMTVACIPADTRENTTLWKKILTSVNELSNESNIKIGFNDLNDKDSIDSLLCNQFIKKT